MKRLFPILMLGLLPIAVMSQDIVSAEDRARDHTWQIADEIAIGLGVTFVDGPYDGEIAVDPCSISRSLSCTNIKGLEPGVSTIEIVNPKTTQAIEDFVYYNAYRNVNAGYHFQTNGEYRKFVEEFGFIKLLEIEVFLLKSGQKPVSLFSKTPMFSSIFTAAQEAYK